MERTYIKNIKANNIVKISGFIENLRDKKSMQFIVIKDISGKVQVTVEKEIKPEIAKVFSSVIVGSVVSVIGKVVANEFVKLGGLEIIPESVEILSKSNGLPINNQAQIEERLNYRWIDLRDSEKALIFKVSTVVEKAMRDFCVKNNFIEIHTPKISSLCSEGGSEVFKLDYFGSSAFLTQSPQFYKQMSMACGFERTFEIADCFRAEQSFTARHATEFTALDVEISYIDSYNDIMNFEEDLINYVLSEVKNKYEAEIREIFGVDIEIPKNRAPRITYQEALNILKEEYNYEGANSDFDTESERLICDYVKKKFGSEFVFITEFPFNQRAFYSMKNKENNNLCYAYDLLWKDVEITSGAQREHRPDFLKQAISEKGIDPEKMQDYIDFFKYGCPPHGGFAIGLARFIAKLLNLSSIKEAIFLFRGPKRILP